MTQSPLRQPLESDERSRGVFRDVSKKEPMVQLGGILGEVIQQAVKKTGVNVGEQPLPHGDDTNANGIPDAYERTDIPADYKLTDDPRYQLATPLQKLFSRFVSMWVPNLHRLKDVNQLQSEGHLPAGTRQAGSCLTSILFFVFLSPIIVIVLILASLFIG